MLALVYFFTLMVPTTGQTVNRVNLGVVFENKGTFFTIYDHWPHTFQLSFPNLQFDFQSAQNVNCTSSSDYLYECKALQNALATLDSIKRHYLISQRHVISLAKEVMPRDFQELPRARSRRSLLPFIGDLSHSLFGTATTKDVNRLKAHIVSLENRQETMAQQFQKYSDDLSSFMSISNHRISTMKTSITDNHKAIVTMAKLFTSVTHNVEDNLRFSVHLAKDIYLAMSLQESLQEFLQGIHALLNHRLSPYLIPFSEMKTTIEHIDKELVKSHSGLRVKPLTANEVYSSPTFQWTFKNDTIFITYQFPLTSHISQVNMYKVHTIATPLHSNTTHVTTLIDMPSYVAFSLDQHYHAYFDDNPIFSGNQYIDASATDVPLYPIAKATCTTAIFFDNTEAVKDLCDYRVELNGIKPAVKYVSEGMYLLVNTSELFLNCPTGRQRVKGCNFCIFKVPCLCDIASENVYFPPRLNECHASQTPVVVHPVNLATLMHFRDMQVLTDISGNTHYSTPPQLSLPDIRLFTHNFSQLIADDTQQKVSLARLAQSVKSGKYVFQSLSEPILEQLSENEGSSTLLSWNSLLTLADTGVLILACIGFVYILFRINRIQTICLALQTAHKVKGVDAIRLFTTQTPTTTLTPHVVTEIDNRILYVLLALAILTLLCISYRYLIRKMRHASIALEITDGRHCVIIPLITVPFCPNFYHAQADLDFNDFNIFGFVNPKFTWCPGSLRITHLLDGTNLYIPTVISVSWLQALKLRSIFKRPFYSYLICQHADHAYQMTVCPIGCDNCKVILHASQRPPVNNRSLYPDLYWYPLPNEWLCVCGWYNMILDSKVALLMLIALKQNLQVSWVTITICRVTNVYCICVFLFVC